MAFLKTFIKGVCTTLAGKAGLILLGKRKTIQRPIATEEMCRHLAPLSRISFCNYSHIAEYYNILVVKSWCSKVNGKLTVAEDSDDLSQFKVC